LSEAGEALDFDFFVAGGVAAGAGVAEEAGAALPEAPLSSDDGAGDALEPDLRS